MAASIGGQVSLLKTNKQKGANIKTDHSYRDKPLKAQICHRHVVTDREPLNFPGCVHVCVRFSLPQSGP
jgi:hypothetical protein